MPTSSRRNAQACLCFNAWRPLLTATLTAVVWAFSALPAALPAPNAQTQAANIFVAPTGTDSNSCGTPDAPCRTIRQGIQRAGSGNVIQVRAGRYEERFLELKSNLTLKSADGPLAARIFSGSGSALRLVDVTNVMIDGFEVSADYDQGPDGDGLVRILDAAQVTVRNCLLHDAPHDADVVKVSGKVTGVLIENTVAYNPGRRNPPNPCTAGAPWFQEIIDFYGSGEPGQPPPVNDLIVRGCWLFATPEQGGDYLLYSKINCENVLYENNIFGPSGGNGCGNVAVGIGTSEPGEPDPAAFVVQHSIVRNNIFVGCRGDAALGIKNANDTWVYNNTFFGNSGDTLHAVIELRGNSRTVGSTFLFNNLFAENRPSQNGAVLYWVRENGLPTALFRGNNLYFNNISASDLTLASESNSLFSTNPLLVSPSIPVLTNPNLQRLAEIRNGFQPGGTSPVLDAGLNAVAQPSHPNWKPGATDQRWDINQNPRPSGTGWDIGAHENSAQGPPQVTVLAPNGGEKLKIGTTAALRWLSTGNREIVSHEIRLSTDGGVSFPTQLATGLAGTAQAVTVTVPRLKTKKGRIEVIARDLAGNLGRDASDANFQIKVL
ncbi:MAG: hypothetical protein K1Y36_04330 [Blastocatellia bacterium]|nr:hypothetical protein [Blastocatellia bacterium]